jgi:hypothetical protein
MLCITIAYWENGFAWTRRGYEYVLMWGLVAFAIALRGGGPLFARPQARQGALSAPPRRCCIAPGAMLVSVKEEIRRACTLGSMREDNKCRLPAAWPPLL